jgi:hypothetical protein
LATSVAVPGIHGGSPSLSKPINQSAGAAAKQPTPDGRYPVSSISFASFRTVANIQPRCA